MEAAMQELPLAVFTTLAPIGAGAFIALAIAFATAGFSDETLKKIDRMTWVAFALTVVGFIASFAHLADPSHAFGALAGIGSSPLSNEIAVGSLVVVAMLAYLIAASAGKLAPGSRKVFAIVIAVLALLFACFTGMAYYVDTIASWATPAVPVSIIGFCLMGGVILGSFILAASGAFNEALKGSFGKVAGAAAVVGLALGIAGACMQFGLASSLSTALVSGAALASAATAYLGGFIILGIIGVAVGVFSLLKKPQAGLLACSAVAVIASVFLARIVFYALEISVGL